MSQTSCSLQKTKWCGGAADTAVSIRGKGDRGGRKWNERKRAKMRKIKCARMRLLQYNTSPHACREKSPLTSLRADLKTRLLCQTVEQTVLLFCSFFFSQNPQPSPNLPQISNSFHCVVVPDKQNLLDQADFTAAPAHMAASVAHFLSSGFFFSTLCCLQPLCFTFVFHFSLPPPSFSTQFSPPIQLQVLP